MSDTAVALRYAKALIKEAKEQNMLEKIYEDVELLLTTSKSNPELRAVVASPIIAGTIKQNILTEIFKEKISSLTFNFMALVIEKRREALYPEIAQEFKKLYFEGEGIVNAEVVSATEMTATNKKKLQSKLEKELGKKVSLTTKVDNSLIGGFVLTVGDRQIDASISRRIQELKNQVLKTVYIQN